MPPGIKPALNVAVVETCGDPGFVLLKRIMSAPLVVTRMSFVPAKYKPVSVLLVNVKDGAETEPLSA